MFYFLIIITGIVDAISSTILRVWANNNKLPFLILGITGFALAGLIFAFSMHYKGLAIANIIWIGFATIVLTLIAATFFKENLNLLQIIGIIVIFAGVVLLSR